MNNWEIVEAQADQNGIIPEKVYESNVCHFNICPDRPAEAINQEAAVWQTYLSAKRKSEKQQSMNAAGYWKNVPAQQWAEFLEPFGMQKEKIYPAPSKIVPVEVLVAKKKC